MCKRKREKKSSIRWEEDLFLRTHKIDISCMDIIFHCHRFSFIWLLLPPFNFGFLLSHSLLCWPPLVCSLCSLPHLVHFFGLVLMGSYRVDHFPQVVLVYHNFVINSRYTRNNKRKRTQTSQNATKSLSKWLVFSLLYSAWFGSITGSSDGGVHTR